MFKKKKKKKEPIFQFQYLTLKGFSVQQTPVFLRLLFLLVLV